MNPSPIRSVVLGIGHYVPEKVITNADLEAMVETSDAWIVQRTGIRERRQIAEHESASTISTEAAKEALARAGVHPDELDLIIVGTVSGDMLFPSTACLVQRNLGTKKSSAFDVGAACAGFIHALLVADSLIKTGAARTVLVVGSDVLTRFVDWTDRSTCVLFGDGAGAVVLRGETGTDRGILSTFVQADGEGALFINLEVGGSCHPACDPRSCSYHKTIQMSGAETYRFAVNAMGDACHRVLAQAGMTADDIDLFVPHQANLRIIESAAKKLGLPDEKVFVNVQKYGNTSGGSIPLALYEAEQEGRLKRGDLVLTVGFGAGLVWGANIIRW